MPTATKSKNSAAKSSAARSSARPSKVVPLGDRVVVKQTRQDEVRASGLVIPDTAREKPQLGVVVAVGPGKIDDNGKHIPIDLVAGDKVLYAKYSGQDVPRGVFGDDDDYMILKDTDVLAKLV